MAEYNDYNSSLTAEDIESTLIGAVVHNKPMSLTDAQKAQARDNIGAGSADNSFVVLGYFATLEELVAAVPEPKAGPFYGVGETEPYDFYSWDELHSRWVNNGKIKGADGKDGQPGSDANITAENIEAALGYVPANPNDLPTTTAPNLIDNSNFEQFVAQAGVGGNHGTQAYAGDRWILESGTVTGTANENGNGYSSITLNGTIVQVVANPPAVGAPVINMVSGTASAVYANGEVIITSDGGVIKNVALYDGEYAVGSEPKYQSKGYGVELVECQRYFINFASGLRWRAVRAASAAIDVTIPLSCPMRKTPSITGELTVNNLSGSAVAGFTFTIAAHGTGGVLLRASKSSHGMSDGYVMAQSAALSADLSRGA